MKKMSLSDLSELTLDEFNKLKKEFAEFMGNTLTEHEREVLREHQELSSHPYHYSRNPIHYMLDLGEEDEFDLESYFEGLCIEVDKIRTRLFYEMDDDMSGTFVTLEIWLMERNNGRAS